MMKKLIFATNNPNKLAEIKSAVKRFEVVGLKEMGLNDDIAETGITLEENALIKSQYIYQKTGLSCFADDTGLEVDTLDGKPGVYSARYAGEKATAEIEPKTCKYAMSVGTTQTQPDTLQYKKLSNNAQESAAEESVLE